VKAADGVAGGRGTTSGGGLGDRGGGGEGAGLGGGGSAPAVQGRIELASVVMKLVQVGLFGNLGLGCI
jgi:hypothetical protein